MANDQSALTPEEPVADPGALETSEAPAARDVPESDPVPSTELAPATPTPPTPTPTPAANSAMPGRPWTIIIAVIVVVVLVAGTLVYGWSQGWFGTTPTNSSTTSSATPATSTTTSSTATTGSAQQLNADFNSADQSLTNVATDSNNAGDSLNDKQGDLSE